MSNNKSIAKNTAYLYLRMLFSMGVTFYSSRIILEALGVSDFGVYNIVGGIVTIFAFLQNALSGATSSYFSFYIGREDSIYLQRFFSNSVVLHILLAGIFVLLGETIGLYFIDNIIKIPVERYNAAILVFHFSLLTTAFNIVTLPYSSLIISYEKMGFYAFQGVLKSVLTLVISFMILYYGGDRLVYYALALLIISFILFLLNFLYVYKVYDKKFRITLKLEKEVAKPILNFFGWDLYGNFSVLVNSQGTSIVLNFFLGAIINAAIGIANQVNSAVNVFVSSFMMAVKPQIIKAYAVKDYMRLQYLVEQLSKFSFYLILLVAIPIIFKMDRLLGIWLKEVPVNTKEIAIIIVLGSFLSVFILPFGYVIHATGKMKRISFISGSFYLLVVPISYFLLQMNDYFLIPFLVNLVALIFVSLNNIYTAKLYVAEIDLVLYFKRAVLPMIVCLTMISIVGVVLDFFIRGSLILDLTMIILLTIINVIIIYIIGLSSEEKKIISCFIKSKLNIG